MRDGNLSTRATTAEPTTAGSAGRAHLEFVPFAPEHLLALALQQAQAALRPMLELPDYGAAIAAASVQTGTALVAGIPVACGGVLIRHRGVGEVWLLFSGPPSRATTDAGTPA
ncbi:MAG: hypothetical protein U1A72_13285, partial [Sulfuritalea sp.]|nr:hypothetical protein [Sulfuritalea sp.]